ncbi:hypothetical protein O9G_001059 [Rozella allomycis CSF55]|uniref:Uncharacterized protein n=1 Tax=Rozella allomycis (strain CSF55) TaxID=988480 RepID=A0A075AN46_ROZAC|nr:hypothetical protein O9G_001059 [Rozella allomycis CSF55]|eukprot:EPZ31148.1 hypothetical protein O9G_001059 [Rozella allomycis CSF55]
MEISDFISSFNTENSHIYDRKYILPKRNIAVCGSTMVYAVGSRVFACDMKSASQNHVELRSSVIDHVVEDLKLSKSMLLALRCKKKIIVMQVPDLTRINELFCTPKSYEIDPVFVEKMKSDRIVKYDWHPLGANDEFLVILTERGHLKMYNVAKSVKCPVYSQVLGSSEHLKSPSSFSSFGSKYVSFCFGAECQTSPWNVAALYLLQENGDIYLLAPFIPTCMRLGDDVVGLLETRALTMADRDTISRILDGKNGNVYKFYYDEDSKPKVQGPFLFPQELDEDELEAVDIYSVQFDGFPILCRVLRNGIVDVCAHPDFVSCYFSIDKTPEYPVMSLLETIDLSKNSEYVQGVVFNDSLIIAFESSIYQVCFGWMDSLLEALESDEGFDIQSKLVLLNENKRVCGIDVVATRRQFKSFVKDYPLPKFNLNVKTKNGTPVDEEYLNELTETLNELRRVYVKYILEINTATVDQIERVQQVKKKVEINAKELRGRFDESIKAAVEQEERIKNILIKFDSLSRRADNVHASLLHRKNSTISSEERELMNDISRHSKMMIELRNKFSTLKSQFERIKLFPPLKKDSIAIQTRKIHDQLTKQHSLIEDLNDKVNKLQIELDN